MFDKIKNQLFGLKEANDSKISLPFKAIIIVSYFYTPVVLSFATVVFFSGVKFCYKILYFSSSFILVHEIIHVNVRWMHKPKRFL